MLDIENIVDTQSAAEELEEVVMGLIINSGQARSLAYGALKMAKQGDFESAKAMMDQSRLALVHAQDHLMTSMLARELVTELIELHEKLK
ncbi:PTS system N,N'-diacetylchitobiose-specific transporter subunit IIA [Citrobacter freundii]|uniref:PTS lactose/cellobiose transporter subunit IIA n=1 Tax=Citrobacter freundii TaxID=546 RepID=UPI003B26BC83